MGAHKTTMVTNAFLLSILGALAMQIGKPMAFLEYFRCMVILQNTTAIAAFLISTMLFIK